MPGRIRGKRPDKIMKRKKKKLPVDQIEQKVREKFEPKPPKNELKTIPRKKRKRPKKR